MSLLLCPFTYQNYPWVTNDAPDALKFVVTDKESFALFRLFVLYNKDSNKRPANQEIMEF